jgi:hypothetical protein
MRGDQVRLEASLKFHVVTVRTHIINEMSGLVPDKKEFFESDPYQLYPG